MRALVVLALAGCAQYARTSLVNAPGNVDLSTPLPNENGDPARFSPVSDPGTRSLVVVAAPTILFGGGREGSSGAAVEPGLEFWIEPRESSKEWLAPALAVTAGIAFAQIYEDGPEHLGAMHVELNARFLLKYVPMAVGVGPAFYADDPQLGGQISVRFPLLTLRGRYMPETGFELFAGYEIPIPFIFSRSK